MCNTTQTAGPSLHPFEKAGLGKAPFQYVGMYEDRGPHTLADGTQVGAPGQPMGTCQYCGQGIALICRVRGADGREFKVGSDCVMKVYKDYGREHADPIVRQVERDRKAHQAALRRSNTQRKMAEARAWFEANRAALEALENPKRPGETRWDQVDWYYRHAGATGLLGLHKAMVKLLASE